MYYMHINMTTFSFLQRMWNGIQQDRLRDHLIIDSMLTEPSTCRFDLIIIL